MDSQERQTLVGMVAALSEEQVREVLAFTRAMLAKAKVDISYNWTAEDMEDFARASLEYADRSLPWDDDVSEGEEQVPQ
jgi:hypothetical protein